MKLDIENKILIPFLMLIILPLLAVGIFFYQSSSNLFRDRLKDEMVKDLNEINNLVERYQDQNPENFINMVNDIKNNRVLLFDIKKDQLYSNNEISNTMKIQEEIIDNINKEEDEFNFEIEGEDKKLFSFKKSKNENWYIGTERSLTPVTFSLLDIQKYTILVAIIFAIIAVEFTILLAHNISKPLKKLADFCKTISEGNYDHHIDINRSDEIGILANSFNNMVDKIHHSTEEIKKVKEINENILRSTSVGLISIDTMGEVITLNRAAEQILKQSSHRKKEIYNKLISFSRKALENKKRINESIDFFDKQIGRIVIEVNTTLLTDRKGKVNGALCTFRDITERKKIEERIEQVDRLSSLGELAAGLAHEIRNPLTGIKTSVQVLKNRLDEEQLNSSIYNNIISEIERMNELVKDILNFAKPGEPKFKNVDIVSIMEETIYLMEDYFNKKEVKVNKEFPEKDLMVRIDPNQGKQIFINLFMNAIKAVEKEGELTLKIKKMENSYVQIYIIDNGKGIKKEYLKRIFEPFYSKSNSGTGLGLSVVKRLVMENKGEIKINSEAGKGTEVIIVLPCIRGDDGE